MDALRVYFRRLSQVDELRRPNLSSYMFAEDFPMCSTVVCVYPRKRCAGAITELPE
jgi:hypothetical protein